MQDSIILPCIISAGYFDSSIVRAGMPQTQNHIIDKYEIEFYLDSCGTTFINEKEYKPTFGTVICAKPGQIRRSVFPLRSYYIHLSGTDSNLKKILDFLPECFTVDDVENFKEKIKLMILCINFGDISEKLLSYSFLIEIVNDLYKKLKKNENQEAIALTSQTAKNNSAIIDAVQYIDEHYMEKLNLADIAAKVNFSPVYFHNMFKKSTGMTPYKYILEKRMKVAKELLNVSDYQIEKISELCGFDSQSYFNYVFKKECGMTPSEYRHRAMNKYYK